MKLFSEFCWDSTWNRVEPVIEKTLRVAMAVPVPNFSGMSQSIVWDVCAYIEECVRCKGHESKHAYDTLCNLHSNVGILEAAGILRGEVIKQIDKAMRSVLFDELRRCGIGQVFGFFGDDCYLDMATGITAVLSKGE